MMRNDGSIAARLKDDYRRRAEELEVMRQANASVEDVHLADVQIRQQLLFDTRMPPVWAKLASLTGWSFEKAQQLIDQVVFTNQNYEARNHRTAAEHEAFFTDIAEKARALRALLERAQSDITENDFASVVSYWSWDSFRETRWCSKLTPDLDEATVRYVRSWLEGKVGLQPFRPTFSDALGELTTVAEKRKSKPPDLKQPNRDNARAQYLARQVLRFFEANMGAPRNDDAAVIASVVAGVDIDGANLARLVKAES
jgi:hypothetical protein